MTDSFEEFEKDVLREMDKIDDSRSFDMFMRVQTSGVFNDYYDDEKMWTPENAVKLADYIMRQGITDDEYLRVTALRLAAKGLEQ